MVKKLFLLILLLIFPSILFSEPSIILNGPYGGKAEIACKTPYSLPNNGAGGECSVYYVDYSTIPGWKFNGGPLEIGYSLLPNENQFWIDFISGSVKLINENTNTTYKIEIPQYFSFESNYKTLHCIHVVNPDPKGPAPVIKVNGTKVSVKPEYLHYFLHIFN